MNLNNKNLVLTGGSTGIGRQLLEILLKNFNCKVITASRHIDVCNDLVSLYPGRLFLFKCDLRNKDEIDALFDFALNQFSSIDLFISNAGIGYFELFRDNAGYEHIKDIFDIDVLPHLYALGKFTARDSKEMKGFVIVNSALGYIPIPGMALYTATKHAVKGFSEAFLLEKNSGLYFATVYPLAVATHFFNKAGDSVPVPPPVRRPQTVAKNIIKGILKSRKRIYTFPFFGAILYIIKVCPIIIQLYLKTRQKAFRRWLKNHRKDSSS